ncbi:alkaline phosphatase [Porticoccaceae bacterium]|nr:alkaline phosphatase [Porticoccaceae bacterium]
MSNLKFRIQPISRYGFGVLALLIWLYLSGCSGKPVVLAQGESSPRKVILIIGDGMDDNQITIARNYLVGARGKLVLDSLPHRSAVQVLTVSEENPEQPIYVADSASSATAMATGTATSRGRIATTAKNDQDIPTIIELAVRSGLKTGVVTTASITDATPASFVAHVNHRGCQGPNEMVGSIAFGGVISSCGADFKANGGAGSIAEQIADSSVDILLGGGLKYFQQPVEGYRSTDDTVLSLAESNGFHVITAKTGLGKLSHEDKVLGLFSHSTLPVRLIGEDGRKAELVGRDQNEYVLLPSPFACENNPNHSNVPSLLQMTEFALGHLSRDSDLGFLLVIESASIDKESHERRTCGHIGETQQLNQALAAALEFSETHPETLIMVTADHGQAAQLIPQQSVFLPIDESVHSPGYVARVKTLEDALMGVNYATNNFARMGEHTGVQVPLYASGPGVNELPSFILQTEIFSIIANYLRLIPPGSIAQ